MAVMEHQLVWQDAPGGAMRVYVLEGGELRVGRSSRCDVVIIHPEVSRSHARLVWQGDTFWVEDLSSTNGTWVNGRRLPPHEPVALKPGDVIGLGPNVRLHYQVLGPGEAPSAEVPPEAAHELAEAAAEEAAELDEAHIWEEDAAGSWIDEAVAASAEDEPPAAAAPEAEVEDPAPDERASSPAAPPPAVGDPDEGPKAPAPRAADAAADDAAATSVPRPWRYLLTGCVVGGALLACGATAFLWWVETNALWCDFFSWVPFLVCP